MDYIETSVLIPESPSQLWVLNYLLIKWCFLWKPEKMSAFSRVGGTCPCSCLRKRRGFVLGLCKQPMGYHLFGMLRSLWEIVCQALIIVCVHTHACQDFSAAIKLEENRTMNTQEDIRGCWFCALKMHDLTKIRQSHKSHLPWKWASFSTNFIFNMKVDVKAKKV